MKRASFAAIVLGTLVALAWPPATAEGALTPGGGLALCEQMTAVRLLEQPAIADDWARAARSGERAEIERMHRVLGEIRAAHGCGDPAPDPRPDARSGAALPPGHPPVGGPGALPPGHPPVPASPRPQLPIPLFQPLHVLST